MDPSALVDQAPTLEPLLTGADHVDVKTFSTPRPLGQFVQRMVSYEPAWLRALFTLRKGLAKVLGLDPEPDSAPPSQDGDIDYTPGSLVGFFNTVGGEPGHYWVGEASDKHLAAYVAVVADDNGRVPRIHAATIVHYRHWTGPLYFNLIRPFHHLIVLCMGRHAAR